MTQFGDLCRATCRHLGVGAALLSTIFNLIQPGLAADNNKPADVHTKTPIQHVIVIVGENRTFDHLFATYQPPAGQTVDNLLSKGIVNLDGTPGPNFALATQNKAIDLNTFRLAPPRKTPYTFLPAPNTQGTPPGYSDPFPAPFQTQEAAQEAEPGLLPEDIWMLTTGASGLDRGVVDTRIEHAHRLANGPFQLKDRIGYDQYAGSPVHRFYQMWQQLDCSKKHATSSNPSGCLADLFPWVEVSIGAGSNGNSRPNPFNNETTHEGSIAMGFYNMAQGDAAYYNQLSQTYTLSDNMHQGVMGGTGANSFMLGAADMVWYSDGKGHVAVPPANQIENPNPQAGTNNWYTQDGYGGGTYSNCSDNNQPGVAPVLDYLKSLPGRPNPNCAPGAYYLLNNYAPGYYGDGSVNPGQFVIPPSTVPTIADSLNSAGISWKYYGEHWNIYLQDPTYSDPWDWYCDICNFAQYSTSIMSSEPQRREHLKDITDFYNDVQSGNLPAVSYVKPSGFVDGHPASSKFDLFEAFVKKIVNQVQANPTLWASTAILITVDEGGGYWDSGYVQPVDFFGDGTRIPFIVVSPYSKGGRVVHTYYDHASIIKFINANWGLSPITGRSRDNLPNPKTGSNPYVPTNSPAIGDLMDMFNFNQ